MVIPTSYVPPVSTLAVSVLAIVSVIQWTTDLRITFKDAISWEPVKPHAVGIKSPQFHCLKEEARVSAMGVTRGNRHDRRHFHALCHLE